MRRILALVVIGLLASAASATAEPPTRAEYIAKMDPRCVKTDRKLKEPFETFAAAIERGELGRAARALEDLVDIYSKSIERLSRIEPPADDANRITRWFDLERRDVDVTQRMVETLKDEDVDRYNRLVEKSRALERKINATLRGYGFKHCN